MEENHLGDVMVNDPNVKEFIKEQDLTKQETTDISNSIASIKVSAIKP